MADLRCNFVGIESPNPFWLASAPPTDKYYNVERAFKAGWGGVVWKTVGEPIVNVTSRYGAVEHNGSRMAGFTNIELISDRPIDVNLREIKQIKREWPDRALVVSLMVPCDEDSWKTILADVEDTGADGIELNFGCPHGMSERGMGSAVGQVPDYVEMVTAWCKKHTRMPVIVKLTPNITDIRYPARAARKGNADAVSLINTIASVIGVDIDTMSPLPLVNGKGTHGGYCGPAVKPVALRMVGDLARDPECRGMGISGIGGISTWRDAAEFLSIGADNVQVCTAAMHRGFKIVEDMIDGLSNWMDGKGYRTLSDFQGAAVQQLCRMGRTRHELRDRRPHRPGPVHQVRPVPRHLRGHLAPVDRGAQGRRRAALRGDRRGMRRLQPVHVCLPGRRLHHHGAGRERQALRRLGRRSTEPGQPGASGGVDLPAAISAPYSAASRITATGRASSCLILSAS